VLNEITAFPEPLVEENLDDGVSLNCIAHPETNDPLVALQCIRALLAPGQELGISDAIDVICDAWNIADRAIKAFEGDAK